MHRSCITIAATLAVLLLVTPAGAQSTATGISRDFNPAISANALLLARTADTSTDAAYNGIDVQEAEVQFTSIVDPFWSAQLTFAVHPEHGHAHGEEEEAPAGYAGDLEQAYVEGTAIPGGFALLLGKDYLPFGKHVPLHTHQFPFVDAPVAVQAFLGEHSATEVGVRAAHAIPLPWYSDLAAYAVDGRSEIFDTGSNELAFGARFVNVFDLSDAATLEVSGSWLHGPMNPGYLMLHVEDPLTGDVDIWGVDATFKWIDSTRTGGPAVFVTGEVILPRPDQGAQDPSGWYAVAQYRFARQWWLGLGAGSMNRDVPPATDLDADHAGDLFAWNEVREYKLNLNWVPSEFSAVRLEGAYFEDWQGDADDLLLSLQVNFTIGSHPAHLY